MRRIVTVGPNGHQLTDIPEDMSDILELQRRRFIREWGDFERRKKAGIWKGYWPHA